MRFSEPGDDNVEIFNEDEKKVNQADSNIWNEHFKSKHFFFFTRNQENDTNNTDSNEKGLTECDTEKEDDDSVERDGDSNLSNHSSPNKVTLPPPPPNDSEKIDDTKIDTDANQSDQQSDNDDNSKPNIKPYVIIQQTFIMFFSNFIYSDLFVCFLFI